MIDTAYSQNTLSRLLNFLTHPIVKDLAWAIGSADLLHTHALLDVGQYTTYTRALYQAWPHLQQLDQDPTSLVAYMIRGKDVRLGRYFENLIFYWMTHIKGDAPIYTDLQIHSATRTLGAFDALVYTHNTTKLWQHWELTLKFYLSHQGYSRWSDWLGPGGKDRLSYKLDRMKTHQFTLAQHEETQTVLQQKGIEYSASTQHQIAMIKGIMFDHYQRCHINLPRSIIADGRETHGIWLYSSALHHYIQSVSTDLIKSDPTCLAFGWRRCIKPHWLAPMYTTQNLQQSMWQVHPYLERRRKYIHTLPLLRPKDLLDCYRQHIEDSGYVMYSLQTLHAHLDIPLEFQQRVDLSQTIDGVWQERHRIFVMPEEWPYL